MSKQEELNQELEKLLHDTKMLLKTVEVKREEVYEGATGAIEKLNSTIKLMEQENVSLQSLPKKLSTQLSEIIPSIAEELHKLNQHQAKELKQTLNNSIEDQNNSIKDSAFRLKQIKDEIVQIDGQRIKRYFLGFGITILISVLASLGASYVMMVKFPKHVQISTPNNVKVDNSEVSLWGSKSVNISGDAKQMNRK
jgi:F0F1-type ATP synthase membrane subunit b/b'